MKNSDLHAISNAVTLAKEQKSSQICSCAWTLCISIHSCLLCPIFSCSSAHVPSAGLIKAAPPSCHSHCQSDMIESCWFHV